MNTIQIYLQIQQDLNQVVSSKWWRRFNRALDPAGAGTPYWYAFYGGSDGAGNAVIIDKETTEILVSLDGETDESYRITNAVYPRWRQLPSADPEWSKFKSPKPSLSVDWGDQPPDHRSVRITDTPPSGDLANIEFGLVLRCGSSSEFICDPTVKNRW